MKIAMVGQKGIPAVFGGVESHVEELSKRLMQRGHDVTVYVRRWYTPPSRREHNGVRLVHSPTVRTKHLACFVHSLTSSVHSLFGDFDIVHYHALGPSFFSWLPRIAHKRTVATVHRLDWQSGKWGGAARGFLKLCERSAVYFPQRTIVVSRTQKRYFEDKYGRGVSYLPNGVEVRKASPPEVIRERHGLLGGDYMLCMGRLVPEKRVEWCIEAFNGLC